MNLDDFKIKLVNLLLQKEVKIGEELIPHIATLTFESNYTQIMYDYGIDVTLVILEILEKQEYYRECGLLTTAIKDYNKLEAKMFPTNYK